MKGKSKIIKPQIPIGRIPIMLRSNQCLLHKKSDEELAQAGECPHDPGGYFVCKGVERVVLIQEQLSKNRIIIGIYLFLFFIFIFIFFIENDKENLCASVTSSSHERKSQTNVVMKHGKMYMKQNILSEDLPVVVV